MKRKVLSSSLSLFFGHYRKGEFCLLFYSEIVEREKKREREGALWHTHRAAAGVRRRKIRKEKNISPFYWGGIVVLYDWFLHSANSQLHRIQNSFLFIIISLTLLSASRGERGEARQHTQKKATREVTH